MNYSYEFIKEHRLKVNGGGLSWIFKWDLELDRVFGEIIQDPQIVKHGDGRVEMRNGVKYIYLYEPSLIDIYGLNVTAKDFQCEAIAVVMDEKVGEDRIKYWVISR